jgi:hypothetical protein
MMCGPMPAALKYAAHLLEVECVRLQPLQVLPRPSADEEAGQRAVARQHLPAGQVAHLAEQPLEEGWGWQAVAR